jgi:predicted Rdx family selenoprotein
LDYKKCQVCQWSLRVLWLPRSIAGQQLIIEFTIDITSVGKQPTALGTAVLQESKEKSIKTFNNIL